MICSRYFIGIVGISLTASRTIRRCQAKISIFALHSHHLMGTHADTHPLAPELSFHGESLGSFGLHPRCARKSSRLTGPNRSPHFHQLRPEFLNDLLGFGVAIINRLVVLFVRPERGDLPHSLLLLDHSDNLRMLALDVGGHLTNVSSDGSPA